MRKINRAMRHSTAWCLILLAFLSVGLISGCAQNPRIQYVSRACPQPPQRTAPFPADNLSPDVSIFSQVQALLMDREDRKADRLILTTALSTCR